jgi:serine/threonine protein kinase
LWEISMIDESRPEKIGRYEIEDELGRGGMATVYRACDPLFEREVAVKVLPPSMLHDPKFRKRFEREGKLIARLEHNAIVPVYDFGEQDGQPYIVMRLMTGGDLGQRIRSGALTREEIGKILARLAGGLDVAHTNGVIHRDLKPGNVLFDNYGDAFLSDFGIARMIESDATLTGTGGIIGTPAYMSPEQIQGDKDIDGRSDIYSLGVILYLMLSGEMPFDGDTPGNIMLKHVLDPVPDISLKHPDISPGVSAIISKAMAKNPDDRYQTAKEMSVAYEASVRGTTLQGLYQTGQPDERAPEATSGSIANRPTTTYSNAGIPATDGSETKSAPISAQASQVSEAQEIAAGQKVEQMATSTPTSSAPIGQTSAGALATRTGAQDANQGTSPVQPNRGVFQAESQPSTAQQTAQAPQKRGNALKWALPAGLALAALAIIAVFVFAGGASRAATAVPNAANISNLATPTTGIAIETQAVEKTDVVVPAVVNPTSTGSSSSQSTPTQAAPAEAPQVAPSETPDQTAAAAPALSEADLKTFMGAANILVYEDIVSDYEVPYVRDTVDKMGLKYKWDGSAKGRILADLSGGPEGGGTWDLVIIAMETRSISSGEVLPYLDAALQQGVSVILEAWNLDQTTNPARNDILDACGVSVKEYLPRTRTSLDFVVYPILGASNPILSEPNTGLSFTNASTHWLASGDLGDLMSLTGSGDTQLLIGTDATQASTGGVLTTCMKDRLTLMTFSSHTFPFDTMEPLWENMIYNGLKTRALYLQK